MTSSTRNPQTEQGITRDRTMLIPRVLIFLRRGDDILLIQGAPGKRLWAGKYNGIGGHVERGEDVLTAARRELWEETGLRAELRLAGTVTVDAGEEVGVGLYVFTGEAGAGAVPRPSAEGTPEWLPLSELADRPLVEDVAPLLGRIRSMRADDPPFAAHSFYEADGTWRLVFAAE